MNYDFAYEIIESTRDENVAVGQWNGIDHNVVRWEKTGNNEQKFIFIPEPDGRRFRAITLREDVHSRIFLAVAPNGNVITWDKSDNGDQLFSLKEVDDKVAFVEGTKNEFLDVDVRSGNIQRWEGVNGNPKDNQLFKLKQLDEWRPKVTFPENVHRLKERHPDLFNQVAHAIISSNLAPFIAKEMAKITPEAWEQIVSILAKSKGMDTCVSAVINGKTPDLSDVSIESEKDPIVDILVTVGISVIAITAILGVLIAFVPALIGAAAIGALAIVAVAISSALLVVSSVFALAIGLLLYWLPKAQNQPVSTQMFATPEEKRKATAFLKKEYGLDIAFT